MSSARRGHGEGSIHKRTDGRWAGVIDLGWEDGKRKRKYVYGATRQEVAKKLTNQLKSRQEGLPVVAEQKTLAPFLDEWLVITKTMVRPRTHQRYEEYVRLHIKPALGRVRISRLTPQHLQRFYAERLEAGASPTSVQHMHRVLHRALKQAVRWGVASQNVAASVDPPRRVRGEMKTLSPEETQRFLECARGDRLEALYVLAVTAGLRQGELLGLRWRDLELDKRSLRVTGSLQNLPGVGLTIVEPKTGRSRRQVVLSGIAIDALRRQRVAQAGERLQLGEDWADFDLVFASSVGTPIHPSNMLRRFRRVLDEAGLDKLRFHDLRHTSATLLLGAGIHPKVVSEMLGHSTTAITLDLYSHVTPTMQQHAADAVDSLLGCQLGCQTGTQ